MKKGGLLVIVLAMLCGVAYAFDRDPRCGKFRGVITHADGKTIYCSNPKYRISSLNTIGIVNPEDAENLFYWKQKPRLSQMVLAMTQRLAKEGKLYRIPIDTKVTVTRDRGGIFKAKILGTDKEFWFLDEYFFLDASREDE